ncbi:MAG TPA: hypothetical protein PKN29_10405 [Candidatus Ozemobacteraceae bacterium]|nr:hypothetical protein [Candidatus Ozemobacteraceae bacterium]
MTTNDWLPELILFSGNWSEYIERIYSIFRQDFVDDMPEFNSRPFRLKKIPIFKGKEATFWHLISEGEIEDERIPDLRRCERICWPRSIIDTGHLHGIKTWKNHRQGKTRVLLALEDFSYVVVLDERLEYYLLWTAYPVEREHQRRKLEREWRNFT